MLVPPGTKVYPGDVLSDVPVTDDAALTGSSRRRPSGDTGIRAGHGAKCLVNAGGPGDSGPFSECARERIIATCTGIVQHEDGVISVVNPGRLDATEDEDSRYMRALIGSLNSSANPGRSSNNITGGSSSDGPSVPVVPPVPGVECQVLLRVTRSNRQYCFGRIIAVRQILQATSAVNSMEGAAPSTTSFQWCFSGGFKGLIKHEDIRPVVPRNRLAPSVVSALPASSITTSGAVILPCYYSYRPGDLLVALVMAQLDARQFVLTTKPEYCGCVGRVSSGGELLLRLKRGRSGEAPVGANNVQQALRAIWSQMELIGPLIGRDDALVKVPGRRDIVMDRATGTEAIRWAPET